MKRISFLRYLTGGLLAGPTVVNAVAQATDGIKQIKEHDKELAALSNDDCPEGMFCINGRCVPMCEPDPGECMPGKWTPHGPTT